jgi:hypothetical protein
MESVQGSHTEMTDLDKVDRDPTTNRLAYAQNMSQEEYLAAENSLKWKLDCRLLSMLWLIFILNYLDRVRKNSFLGTNNMMTKIH